MSYQDDDIDGGASCEEGDSSEEEEDEDVVVEDVEDVQEEKGGEGEVEEEEESYDSYRESIDEGSYNDNYGEVDYTDYRENFLDSYEHYNNYDSDSYSEFDYSYGGSSDEDGDSIGTAEAGKFGVLKAFALNFNKGNYDNVIEDALRRDSSATINAEGHQDIRPDDWEERRAISLENLKSQLQEYTSTANADVGVLSQFHLVSSSTRRTLEQQIQPRRIEEEVMVPHDPCIDSHWQELLIAMGNAADKKIQMSTIRIEKVEMRKETVSALVRSLCGRAINSIKFVSFINTNICGEGVVSLSKLVEQCSGMLTLNLSHNRIDDMNSALCLSKALKPHLSMDFLAMHHCDLGNNPEILAVILQSDVKHIYLTHNNIDSLGAVKISEYLAGNPPVTCLTLDNNDFDDDDALLISQALKKNTNLSRLYLRWNNFTSVGVKALYTSFFDGTSLNAISESNHTCELRVFDKCTPIQELLSSFNEDLDRSSKILIALHDKVSLLEYLTDMPVELMPEVLAFLQRKMHTKLFWEGLKGYGPVSSQSIARMGARAQSMNGALSLNRMYSAMRWWNMPFLYSFHRNVSPGTKRKRDD